MKDSKAIAEKLLKSLWIEDSRIDVIDLISDTLEKYAETIKKEFLEQLLKDMEKVKQTMYPPESKEPTNYEKKFPNCKPKEKCECKDGVRGKHCADYHYLSSPEPKPQSDKLWKIIDDNFYVENILTTEGIAEKSIQVFLGIIEECPPIQLEAGEPLWIKKEELKQRVEKLRN